MSLTALTLDGLLRHPTNGGVLETGRLLYAALSAAGPLAVLADEPGERARTWLEGEGLSEHVHLVERALSDPEPPAQRRLAQIRRLRATAPVDLVLDPDPDVIEALYRAGIPAALTLHPSYAAPAHRPDHRGQVTPWGDLVAEINRVRALKAADARTTADVL